VDQASTRRGEQGNTCFARGIQLSLNRCHSPLGCKHRQPLAIALLAGDARARLALSLATHAVARTDRRDNRIPIPQPLLLAIATATEDS
jgi:hypothetical protein